MHHPTDRKHIPWPLLLQSLAGIRNRDQSDDPSLHKHTVIELCVAPVLGEMGSEYDLINTGSCTPTCQHLPPTQRWIPLSAMFPTLDWSWYIDITHTLINMMNDRYRVHIPVPAIQILITLVWRQSILIVSQQDFLHKFLTDMPDIHCSNG